MFPNGDRGTLLSICLPDSEYYRVDVERCSFTYESRLNLAGCTANVLMSKHYFMNMPK